MFNCKCEWPFEINISPNEAIRCIYFGRSGSWKRNTKSTHSRYIQILAFIGGWFVAGLAQKTWLKERNADWGVYCEWKNSTKWNNGCAVITGYDRVWNGKRKVPDWRISEKRVEFGELAQNDGGQSLNSIYNKPGLQRTNHDGKNP